MVKISVAYKKMHFIGIGGIHMSGLAEMCKLFGCGVSGSDAKRSDITDRLTLLGIPVAIGHSAVNIDPSVDLIVYTSAVKEHNPEMARARELNLRIMDKAGLLGHIMEKYKQSICVSGSHGKTSTTAMIAETLYGLDFNLTIMNGGICTRLNASMFPGGTRYFVTEADEYYDAFLKMKPHIGVILNIDHDHADYFPTFDSLWQSFYRFARLIDENGALVVHGGIPDIYTLTDGLKCSVITYGTEDSNWQAGGLQWGADGFPVFKAMHNGKNMGTVRLSVPGEHNADNALAALAVCYELGASIPDAAAQLIKSKGAARRFQLRKTLNGASIIDDYAHHPAEIRATLYAAKKMLAGGGRLIAAFQPHTRSRTLELYEEFVVSFNEADKILLLDIFTPSGREESHINIASADLCKSLLERGKDAVYRATFDEAAHYLRGLCEPGDIVIIMGAGDIIKLEV